MPGYVEMPEKRCPNERESVRNCFIYSVEMGDYFADQNGIFANESERKVTQEMKRQRLICVPCVEWW